MIPKPWSYCLIFVTLALLAISEMQAHDISVLNMRVSQSDTIILQQAADLSALRGDLETERYRANADEDGLNLAVKWLYADEKKLYARQLAGVAK